MTTTTLSSTITTTITNIVIVNIIIINHTPAKGLKCVQLYTDKTIGESVKSRARWENKKRTQDKE